MTTVAVPLDTGLGAIYHMYSGAEQDTFISSALGKYATEDYNIPSHHYDNGKMKVLDNEALPADFISLSFDLLNQVQNQIQEKHSSNLTLIESSSQISVQEIEDVSEFAMATVSMTPDSSSYPVNNFHRRDSDSTDSKRDTDSSLSQSSQSPQNFSHSDATRSLSSQGRQLYTAELQVLCRICGDRASGFHYGVHSCEGCKGFFRRTLKKQLVYKPCRESAHCSIDTGTRNKCQYCRYQKCLKAGMSQNAVRFGRMPKAEREKLVADKEELQNTCSKRILELRSLSDCIRAAFQDCFRSSKLVQNYLFQPGLPVNHVKVDPDFQLNTNCITAEKFADQKIYQCFQDVVIPLIEGTVKFTKKIPDFPDLPIAERIILLKQNCFCVVLVLTYLMYEDSTLFISGEENSFSLADSNYVYACKEVQCLFEGIFSVSRKFKLMNLKVVEIALFCSILLLIESPGISNYSQVEKLQLELINSLRLELKHNHPKDKLLFARLLVTIPQLVQIVEEFKQNTKHHIFDSSPDFQCTHDLLIEIFDLR